ncbi:nickel pincer cofactor biosynthesis protein LarC [Anaeromyxobacter oryzisoli]|uniref:nickel pincer cofactor biosynthesis protein LarC n=1 Tax=Anaeromyxobacter oryzisoli TaxID=2925408 RepID=UPI001F59C5EF|nr:nickel pincer cofactor biosynthesis protein LarC [Anaeromyxobacter sp. SG63]
MTTSLLVLEPVGGIAGDMFMAAAIDLGVDRGALVAALETLKLPGWRLEVRAKTEHGIRGTHVDVVVEGEQPHERGLAEILALVDASGLAPRARAAARAIFERIGRAEAKVHGIPVERVHFHEVGAIDSIVDVCGAAVVLDLLGWPRVVSTPPELGRGMVRTAHGVMPVPPPAVLELLAGLPIRPGGPQGEAVTPTGAALLAELAQLGPLPSFVPGRIGYGVGTAAWPDRPNVLRMTSGELYESGRTSRAQGSGEDEAVAGASPGAAEGGDGERLWVLEANLDDCPGQLVARAIEAALEAGALDAWAAPVTMKKGRPGILLGALCDEGRRAAVTAALFAETTTLGVRRHAVERDVLARRLAEVATPYGAVRVKIASRDGHELGAHPEYDDCLARARERGVAVREVMDAALAAYRARRTG